MTLTKMMVPLQYATNGVRVNFPYDDKIFDAGDLEVYLLNAENQESLAVLNQDYTVTGVGNESGGAVVFTTAPATSQTLTIRRALPLVQTTAYVENDDFPAEGHEKALDKIVMITQQLQEQAGRTLRLPSSVLLSGMLPVPVATKFLRWNTAADALENVEVLESEVVGEVEAYADAGDAATLAASLAAAESYTDAGDAATLAAAESYADGMGLTKISHSLATALNDFLVASGVGVFVKKTLAEVKTILGLGSAAYTDSGDYAVAAKGVTNGDSHDHAGGDGGQVDHGGLGGLADDDHTQYIKHALATAVNDFLVASAAGVVGRKSLSDTKVLLESIGSPAPDFLVNQVFN